MARFQMPLKLLFPFETCSTSIAMVVGNVLKVFALPSTCGESTSQLAS